MAKSKALIAAELRIAALEAQVLLARTCYRALKASHRVAEHPASQRPGLMPVVTRYYDSLGREWVKTRIGNKASSRLVSQLSN